jgi:flagellar motor component MotA
MRVILFWLGALGFLALGQIIEGGHVGSVMQLTAAIIVFGPCLAFLFYRFGFIGFFKLWARLLSSKLENTDSDALDKLCLMSFMSGTMGAVLGLIHVMENLADSSKLGAGIAVAFVSIVYGTLPSILFTPFINESQNTKSSLVNRKTAGFYAASSFIILLFSFFTILYATSTKA